MFKTTQFKKAKGASKTIVGRVVEVDKKEVDENEYRHPSKKIVHNYNVKSSTPVRKGAISASVSKLFAGTSSAKSSSTTRTPGRKLLKKLICTPGKTRSIPDTSISEADDSGVYIPNSNYDFSGVPIVVPIHPSFSSEEIKVTDSSVVNASGLERMTSSPQKLARKLLEDQFTHSNQNVDERLSMKPPTRESNHQMSIHSVTSIKNIDVALATASDRNEDMIFLTNSSSSDECDERNENESNPMSRLASSHYDSPPGDDRLTSLSSLGHIAMKSPGIPIPTPAIEKMKSSSFTEDHYSTVPGLQFPFPIRNFPDSPMKNTSNATVPNPKDSSTQQFEEEDDEDAFLPNDFMADAIKPKYEEQTFLPNDFMADFIKPKDEEKTFTLKEVEQQIKDARREERLQLRMQHDKILQDKVNEFEKVLFDSGAQWKKDSDEQEAKYERRLKGEERKVSQKHYELINKVRSLEDLTGTLKETEGERDSLKLRVSELETVAEKTSESSNQDLDSLRKAKEVADSRITELEFELSSKASWEATAQCHQDLNNELTIKLSDTDIELNELRNEVEKMEELKIEKESADQQAAELSEKLRVLTESSDQYRRQLEDGLKEITLLKGQLAELPSIDPEEMRTSKLEVENLRNLRAEDGKEIEALQNQLSQIVGEHQDVFTPQKKKINSSYTESPYVGEIDRLRVDYNKAQDQLKSMGKILKRYKSERDDVKAKVQELEQRHVHTIEIAVKQATEVLKEEIEDLLKENEALSHQMKTKDIGEQIIEKMKEHMEELKKCHEAEVAQFKKNLDDSKRSADEQQQILEAQLQTERKKLVEDHEKEIKIMKQYIDQIQNNAKGEIERLEAELCQIKLDFEEKTSEIIKTKSKECEVLENQMNSMHEMHTEELELIESENLEEGNGWNKKIAKLQKELDAKVAMTSKFEESLEEVKGEAKIERIRLQAELDSLQEEKDAEMKKVNELKSHIGEIQAQTKTRIEKEKIKCNRQIYELRKQHGSESDELLAQLDLIEAETDQRCQTAETAVREKDAVITALGYQLAESESRSVAATKTYDRLKQEFESLRRDLDSTNASNKANQIKISDLIANHSREIDEQIALKEAACNEAREEMIALAEGQLAERQEVYQALKRELDNAQSKVSVLKRELRFATKELEEMSRRHEGQEADLRDELAQSKAALATKEATLLGAEKVHQVELHRVRDAEKAMKSKFEESQVTRLSLQKTLAATVTEKQRVETELAEVTAISEELATMLERLK